MTDAQKERAAVVAWLQDQAADIGRSLPARPTPAARKAMMISIGARLTCAAAIERGDHLK